MTTQLSIVRQLNAQHMQYSAGFYAHIEGCPSARFFRARTVKSVLQVFDFDNWHDVPRGTLFTDHNGRDILTY